MLRRGRRWRQWIGAHFPETTPIVVGGGVLVILSTLFTIKDFLAPWGLRISPYWLLVLAYLALFYGFNRELANRDKRLRPSITFPSVDIIRSKEGGNDVWAMVLTMRNDSGRYIDNCVVRVPTITKVGSGRVPAFYPGYLRFIAWETHPAPLWHAAPGDEAQICIAFIADNDPEQKMQLNWGPYSSAWGQPDSLEPAAYDFYVVAEARNKIHGTAWVRVEPPFSMRIIDPPADYSRFEVKSP